MKFSGPTDCSLGFHRGFSLWAVRRSLAVLSLAACLPVVALSQSTYTPYTFTTLAGLAGSAGSADGAGSTARFYNPNSLAVDSAGNVYVADSGNNTIRKITSAGVVTTLVGLAGNWGSTDGTGSAARFNNPCGVAVDSTGNVYVADTFNNTIRKVTPAGVVTTLAGSVGSAGSADGAGSAAPFFWPEGVAVDSTGIVYVADLSSSTIRKITPAGAVTTLAGLAGSTGGTVNAALFSLPRGVAVDGVGNVYVADTGNNRIRQITPSGVVTMLAGLVGGLGSADGTGSAAHFNQPNSVAVDSAGNVYVADTGNNTIRQITPSGVVTTLAGLVGGLGSADGTGSAAQFYQPSGVAVDSAGNVYVADTRNNTIRKGTLATAPAISTQPLSQIVMAGSNQTFAVVASGMPPPSYQWAKNGTSLAGATNATLTLNNVAPTDAGSYTVVISNSLGSITSSAATLTVNSSRLTSLSVRAPAGTGDQTLILGFYIGGTGSKQVLIRGVGPTLAQYGVSGVLADPQLKLFNVANALINQNDNWGGSTALANAFVAVDDFALPTNSRDAALLVALPPNGYSAQVNSVDGSTGVAMIEAYEADTGTPGARFTALSARNQVGTGDNILIAGFAVTGNAPKKLLIRGIGPTLANYAVSGVLADPKLDLYSGNTWIEGNDNWGGAAALSDAFTATQAFPLPANSKDAALLVTLQPGIYSAQVSGVGGTTGVALVEVYEMDASPTSSGAVSTTPTQPTPPTTPVSTPAVDPTQVTKQSSG